MSKRNSQQKSTPSRPKTSLTKRGAAPWRYQAWRPLQRGDLVDLIAPGFSTSQDEVDAAVAMLESWGLRARVPKPLFGPDVVSSHRDEVRAQHLLAALKAQDSSAIWCLRGGYGAIRLLGYLDQFRRPPQPTKLCIGYSDVTTLHTYFMERWRWAVVHGPLVNSAAKGSCDLASVQTLREMIFGQRQEVCFSGLRPMNLAAETNKKIGGPIVGGNLTVVQSGIGTPYALGGKGRIVFFEDLGERGYRVDRILVHLAQSGFFKQCRGVIFGEFIGGLEHDGSSRVPGVIARFAEEQKFPVLQGLPIGHGDRQMPLPMGTKAQLDLSQKTLTVECGWGVAVAKNRRQRD